MDYTELLDTMTHNAQVWEEYLKSHSERIETTVWGVAFDKAKKEILDIINDEITNAVQTAKEFDYAPLKDRLLTVFKNEKMIGVTADGFIYLNTYYAGDDSDFWDGIRYARKQLDVSKKSTKEQRAAYWRNKVYGTDLYDGTMEFRLTGWKELAPFWIYLDSGNAGDNYAYPQAAGTSFVYKIEQKATKLLKTYKTIAEEEARALLDSAIERFLVNPEQFATFEVLDTFIGSNSRQYEVYVTSTRRIGVALPETRKRLAGR